MTKWNELDKMERSRRRGDFGFVYKITNHENNKKYIGSKQYLHIKKVKKKGGGHYVYENDSGWRDYWGSNEMLLTDIETAGFDQFSRELIYLCQTKGDMKYLEAMEIFRRNAIPSDEYYNEWIENNAYRKSALSAKLIQSVNNNV